MKSRAVKTVVAVLLTAGALSSGVAAGTATASSQPVHVVYPTDTGWG